MFTATALFIAAVFMVAGIIKGVLGLGLQVVPMGLLVLVMKPIEAAALLVIPAFVTNAWQLAAGPALGPLLKRLWPTMAGICVGTWAGSGAMGPDQSFDARVFVGLAVAAYALLGLAAVRFTLPNRYEVIAGPVAGAATGLITAATGIFVIPAVPYLVAIGLEKDDLVQALGLSFFVSTVALAINLWRDGALGLDLAGPSAAVLVIAMVGVWVGQWLRSRIEAQTFRRLFFAGLLALGLHIVVRALT